MANYRRGRVNEEIQREMASIIRDVKDPRVSSSFISITGVDCAPDLRNAKIFYSCIGGKDGKEGVAKGLKSAAGFIRHELAVRLNMRQTPELLFVYDKSVENGAHIASLLKEVEADLTDDEEEKENGEQ